MKKLLITLALLASLSACTRPDSAERTLHQQGFTEIKVTGYGWLSCSEDDVFRTNFRAKAVNGDTVEGTVCEGLFKGKTVRLD